MVNKLPDEYRRWQGLTAMALMPLQSFQYGLSYNARANPGESRLAALGNIFRPAQVNINVASQTPAHDIPILLYHGIVQKPDRFSMTPETFADQMFTLKKAGYHTITLADLQAFMEGRKELDNKSFLLTFDDARIDAYFGADPILQAAGFTAVMYVATADSLHVLRPLPSYYIHEGLLGRMVRSGRWELGSHAIQETGGFVPIDAAGTQGNFLSNKMWLQNEGRLESDEEYRARITRELAISKRDLEDSFSTPIDSMSFPFGDFGQQTKNYPESEAVIEEIVRAHYTIAFRQAWQTDSLYTSNYPGTDLLHLRRIEPATDWSGERVFDLIENARAKNIGEGLHDTFASNTGWKSYWGGFTLKDNRLNLRAGTTTTGSLTFWDGTHDWEDYSFGATIESRAGEYVSLLARYQNNENYLGCWFSDGTVKVQEKVDGVTRTLQTVRNPVGNPVGSGNYGVSVQGSTVECLQGSRLIASSSNISPALSKGGIGITIWDPENAKAGVSVVSVDVTPAPTVVVLDQ